MNEAERPEREFQEQGSATRAPVDVRQQLAADQTLLAWIRTAIAMSGLGFVVARFNLFLGEIHRVSSTSWEAARVIGLVLVAAAAFLLILGLLQHRQVRALLADHGDPLAASRWPAVAAGVVSLRDVPLRPLHANPGGRHRFLRRVHHSSPPPASRPSASSNKERPEPPYSTAPEPLSEH